MKLCHGNEISAFHWLEKRHNIMVAKSPVSQSLSFINRSCCPLNSLTVLCCNVDCMGVFVPGGGDGGCWGVTIVFKLDLKCSQRLRALCLFWLMPSEIMCNSVCPGHWVRPLSASHNKWHIYTLICKRFGNQVCLKVSIVFVYLSFIALWNPSMSMVANNQEVSAYWVCYQKLWNVRMIDHQLQVGVNGVPPWRDGVMWLLMW